MTVYYVDSTSGSDGNSGTSASSPLASMAAVENLTLGAGDSVLFARGSSYDAGLVVKYSGTADHPITFGAYGDGDDPVIGNATTGIYGSKTQNIVVQDVTVAHTTGNAIFALKAANWTVRNVHVEGTGNATTSGAISFENGTNMTVRDTTITGVTGDGIWIDGGKNIVLENNHIGTVQGSNADAIQVGHAANVSVIGNTLDMSGVTNSTKGDLVVNNSNGVIIENNTLIGGSYGASVNSNDVTIANNEIYGQSGYSWTFGIGIGETWAVRNYNIYDNYIHDVKFGVAVTGKGTDVGARTSIDVHDNTFDNITGAALKVDRAATGDFVDNAIGSNSPPTRISPDVSTAGTFGVDHNGTFQSTGPQAVADAITVPRMLAVVGGHLLANDVGSSISLLDFAGRSIGDGLSVAGKYGTVTVNPDGTFSYAIDKAVTAGLTKGTTDVFSYLITDGQHESVTQLTVTIAPRVNIAPVAVNDIVHLGSSGSAEGSVLANDTDRNADTLYVRTVSGHHVGTAPVTIDGLYGTLTITDNGQFTYSVDPTKVGTGTAMLTDAFMYKISDTSLQDTGGLAIYIDPHSLATHTVEQVG